MFGRSRDSTTHTSNGLHHVPDDDDRTDPTTRLTSSTVKNPSSTASQFVYHEEIFKGLPGFICKLYKMVNDDRLRDLISWTPTNDSFIIYNPDAFAKEVLPKYCKHNNFSSFIRQLNMYGFHKVPHLQGGLQGEDADIWEFRNANFERGRPALLANIKRKVAKASTGPADLLKALTTPSPSSCSSSNQLATFPSLGSNTFFHHPP